VSLECLQEDANGEMVYTFTHPWSDGTTGTTLSPLELLEKLAALVPLPHVHLVRYGGYLAPHSHLRGAILLTRRQRGLAEPEAYSPSPRWSWARRRLWVFDVDMATCPFYQRRTLRLIAVITQGEVIRKILCHLKLAVDPPPIAPARSRRAPYDWVAQAYADTRRLVSHVRAVAGWHTSDCVRSRLRAPRSVFSPGVQCAMAAGGKHCVPTPAGTKRLVYFLSTRIDAGYCL
jgi:hypothetical protein